ncbi:molybdopterin-dependent oxidoreductase [Thermodesulfobacteriota bacterium B35]
MKGDNSTGQDVAHGRRAWLKTGVALAGASLLPAATAGAVRAAGRGGDPRAVQQAPVARDDGDVRIVHSVCLGCNARCGNRALVRNGRLETFSGNPYHPYNHQGTPVPYDTPVSRTLDRPSPVCAKAHDSINATYNPYRILRPLKRSGPRGSGRFEPVSWEQLIAEVTDGGRLFAHLGEDRHVPGLRDLDSDTPLDPEAPELGPVRNRFVFMSGRMQSGRKEFIDRFVKHGMGSINRIGHTDICGLGFRMGNLALTEKKQVELKADPWGASYILVFGANIYEALQPGINTYGAAIARRHARGEVKFVIIDPRAQNASVHAHDWLPVRPGCDGALAMAMIRRMIEKGSFNRNYLEAPNPSAAAALDHGCYCNATHLVIDDPDHPDNGAFLRMHHLRSGDTGRRDGRWVVLGPASTPVPFDAVDRALLDEAVSVKGADGRQIRVATAFRMMRQGVMAHSMDEYAGFCGIDRARIERTADEFAAHGTRAAVCQYHGAGNYAGGTHAAFAVAMLSCLAGSVEMRGGYMSSGGGAADPLAGLYDLKRFPGRRNPAGIRISREKARYEESSEFRRRKKATGSGYPATRPWFAFTKGGLSVETLAGIDAGYPYSCGILFTYFYDPLYSTPGGYRFRQTFMDGDRIPLHVSIDTCINESNLYADYIVPDVTYVEGHYGWLTPHAPALRFTGVRTPCIEPLTGATADGRPCCLETFLIDLARRAGLPGFGEEAIPARDGRFLSLRRAEDFYVRAFANIAANAGLPEATAEEVEFVNSNYPVARFRDRLTPRQWRQTCYLLARGGVFQPYEQVFAGQRFRHGVRRVVLYNEELAASRNALTGERFSGTLCWQPPADAAGRILAESDQEYPFALVTHKMNVHTQSRTTSHRWTMELVPENFVVMHVDDARDLGLHNDDRVRLVSRSNPGGICGRVRTGRLVRRGCVAVSFHYGHTQHGASRLEVAEAAQVFLGGPAVTDDHGLVPDPKRGAGLNPNMVSRLDARLGNTPLVDLIGGIPDFSSTRVQIIRVAKG